MSESKFYDFSAKSIQGEDISMSKYKGKVVLVVNTASKCGFTPQLNGLEKLYENHHKQGVEVLGFPCNQFGGQEPGSEEDIQQGCMINYGVTFQMFSKVDVNGDNAHPLFKYLKSQKKGLLGSKIKWNFTKFLINQQGYVVKRFASTTKPESIEKYIKNLLG
jgi:glutathione peroxidase